MKREVFICVPHRGSEVALGSIGYIGRKLISLPATLLFGAEKALGMPLEIVFGKGHRLPTSIDGLSPRSALLTALDPLPIHAPHHSIIGDRGRGDTPHSSDGTMPYWSSHLDSAETELIVPGPHGSYALPQTIAELRRILTLNLDRQAATRRSYFSSSPSTSSSSSSSSSSSFRQAASICSWTASSMPSAISSSTTLSASSMPMFST